MGIKISVARAYQEKVEEKTKMGIEKVIPNDLKGMIFTWRA
jgi:hypothetical protein